MSIRRNLGEIVPHLLNVLRNVMARNPPESPELVDRCRFYKEYFEKNEDFLPKLKHLEDELLCKFAEFEQCIDNPTYDGCSLCTIEQSFNRIKQLISENQLNYKVPQPKKEETQSEGRKMSDDWSLLRIEESILESPAMATFQLSYTILDLPLKMCLLCFAIFPEKAIIRKSPLIYWWIGEGFVRATNEKTAEEVGEEAFQKLIDMGLIHPEYKKPEYKKCPVVNSCTMHPWIRHMVITVAKKAEFFDLDRRGAPTGKSSQSRRLCFAKDLVIDQKVTRPNINESEDQQPSLTLFNTDQKYQLPFVTLFNIDQKRIDIKEEWFSKLNRVAVLQLGSWWWQNSINHELLVENKRFLNHLGALKKLKYISLQGIAGIKELPSSVLELVHLVILDLKACHNLERLPPDISPLRNLACLDISDCIFLERMPTGLDNLKSLRVLKGFAIETSSNSDKPFDLSQLKKLRKLGIYIPKYGLLEEEDQLPNLEGMENLRVLTVTWKPPAKGWSQSEQKGAQLQRDLPMVKPFSFPSKLEKLDLRCIHFEKTPEWLKPSTLKSLKKLYIRGGKLDNLGSEPDEQWKVKILRLRYLHGLDIQQDKLPEQFPHLIYYEKINCLFIKDQYNEDEVWAKEYDGDERWSRENIAGKPKPVASVQGKEEMVEETEEEMVEEMEEMVEEMEEMKKESNVQESMKVWKQDNDEVLMKAETQATKTSKVVSNESDHRAHASNQDSEEEKEESTAEKSTKLVRGDNTQVLSKVEDKKASSSKVLTNEPNLTSTSVGKKETKEDTKVKESKELVKQGENKVEDLGGSTHKLIPNESSLVSPITNEFGNKGESQE